MVLVILASWVTASEKTGKLSFIHSPSLTLCLIHGMVLMNKHKDEKHKKCAIMGKKSIIFFPLGFQNLCLLSAPWFGFFHVSSNTPLLQMAKNRQ